MPGRKSELVCVVFIVSILVGQTGVQSATLQPSYQGFYTVRIDGKGMRRLIGPSDGAIQAISPNRRTVVVQRVSSDLETVSLATGQHRALVTLAGITGGGQGLVTWSPGGKTIAFDRADDSACPPPGDACAI